MGHEHHHHSSGNEKEIGRAFFLNLSFTIIELIGGIITHSMAVISDAIHDFGDAIGLGLSWYFEKISKKGRTPAFSYGYRRFSLLAAFINANILIVGSIIVIWHAVPQIIHPEPVNEKGMIFLAILGIGFNTLAMLRLKKGNNLHFESLKLHFLSDVLGWVAILVVAIILLFVDLPILDPILSVVISLYILIQAAKNLMSSLKIFLQAVPKSLKIDEVKERLLQIPNVISVHDLHLWSLEGTSTIMTSHIVIDSSNNLQEAENIKRQCKALLDEMHIHHATIEIESEKGECTLLEC